MAAIVTLVVFLIYFRTMAPTMSLWDCGEYIASAFTFGVVHPPGSPLFLLLGRLFSMLPLEVPAKALGLFPEFTDGAFRVNLMSPIAAALSALFAYLIILRLIRGNSENGSDGWSEHVGAAVGTLIYAFADSNWFNAVEAEVYAYAILLMMMALYLGLRWTDTIGKPKHLSLTLFLAYLIGLASGLHLLCLLVLPSIGILGLFGYVKSEDENDTLEALLLPVIMVTASLFVLASGPLTWFFGFLTVAGGVVIIITALRAGRDPWVILGATVLLAAGGYMGLHFLNAYGMPANVHPQIIGVYGFENRINYMTVAFLTAAIFGVGGIALTFMTKKVGWRDIWAVLLVTVAAAATTKFALGLFFYFQGVDSFPAMWVGVLTVTVVGLAALYSGSGLKPGVKPLPSYHLLVSIALLVVVGYSTYLALMIRSGLNPAIDENNPENWTNLFNFLARKQYGSEDMSMIIFQRRSPFNYQFWQMLVKYILQQFPLSLTGSLFDWKLTFRSATTQDTFGMRVPDIPLLLTAIGMYWHYKQDRHRFVALFALFIISGIGLSIYLNMPDPQPRERDYVFTGAISVMAIWMGMAVTGLIRSAKTWLEESAASEYVRQKLLPGAVAVFGLAIPVLFLTGYPLVDQYSMDQTVQYSYWDTHDRRYDIVGYEFAYNVLESCEPNAILFTNGDNDTFSLWYMQEVVGVRKDVRVVNLSLLNTDWYIMQLRDNEPRIPMSSAYTDDYITNSLCAATLDGVVRSGRTDLSPQGSPYGENGRLIGWRTKEVRAAGTDTARAVLNDGRVLRGKYTRPSEGVVQITPDGSQPITVPSSDIRSISTGYSGIAWTLPRPTGHQVLRVQDVMVYNIVHWINWARPIYFAITVGNNRIGLDSYLRMQGPVFKLVREENLGLDIEASKRNLNEICRMSFLKDSSVYQYENMHMFASNYRVAYLQLADAQMARGDFEAARASFDSIEARLPWDWRGAYSAARIAYRGPGQAQMRDLSRRYGRIAVDILRRHADNADQIEDEIVEGARAVSQLLKFCNDPMPGAELLVYLAEQTATQNPFTGIHPVTRLGLLFDAAVILNDNNQYSRAAELFRECRDLLAHMPASGPVNTAIYEMFRMDALTFDGQIRALLAETESRIQASSATDTSTSQPNTPQNEIP